MSTIIIQSGSNCNEIRTIEVLNTNVEHLFKVMSKDEISQKLLSSQITLAEWTMRLLSE